MPTTTTRRPATARPSAPRTRPAPALRAKSIDPFRVLRRHMLVIIAACIFGGGLGVGAFLVLQEYYPLYTGQVLFEVRPGLTEAGDVSTKQPLQDDEISRIANTQLVLLTSREVLTSAMGDPDVQSKTTWFRENYMKGGTPMVAEAVDELTEKLKTSTVRGTELFQVAWSTHQSTDVPIVLNAVGRAYLTKRQSLDNAVHNETLELFKGQLRDTTQQIEDISQEIEDFIRSANITSLTDPRYHETSIAVESLVQQIAVAQQALSMATSSQLQTAAKLDGRMQPSAADILEAENDHSVAAHVRMEESMKYQLRLARERYREDHPTVRAAEASLRAAEEERQARRDEIIRRNLNARLKLFSDERERTARMLEAMENELEEKGTQLSELAAQQSQFESLRSRRTHLETARDSDRRLIKEIEVMRLRSDAERVGIAQMAQTPREKSFPQLAIVVPLGVLLSLSFVMGIIFLREVTDQRVQSASDLTVIPGVRLLGVIPDLHDDPTKAKGAELVIRTAPSSVVAESYRQTCAPLITAMDRAGHQTLLFVSGLPSAGTTTAVSNVAAGLAATGRRTLVLDANFRRPRLASVMGVTAAAAGDDGKASDPRGLGDVLTGEADVDAVIATTESGVDVIPAGTAEHRVIERLNSDRLDQLLASLRARYDVILVDAAPAVVAGDAMVLANKLDAAVLLVRASQEQRGLVARLIAQFSDAQCELLGVVLNRPRETAGGYFKKNFATMADYAKAS